MMDQEFLTVQELAAKLRVKPSWVYGQTRQTGPGTLPRLQVGKYIRFNLDEVLSWLKKQAASN